MLPSRPQADPIVAGTNLTPRQRDVLHLLSFRLTNAEIAAVLSLSQRTVECHVASILAALQVANRREAAAIALRDRDPSATSTDLLRTRIATSSVPTAYRHAGDEMRKNY